VEGPGFAFYAQAFAGCALGDVDGVGVEGGGEAVLAVAGGEGGGGGGAGGGFGALGCDGGLGGGALGLGEIREVSGYGGGCCTFATPAGAILEARLRVDVRELELERLLYLECLLRPKISFASDSCLRRLRSERIDETGREGSRGGGWSVPA
jgi:hypothetical protein